MTGRAGAARWSGAIGAGIGMMLGELTEVLGGGGEEDLVFLPRTARVIAADQASGCRSDETTNFR